MIVVLRFLGEVSGLRPIEMAVEEPEGSLCIDRVRSVKKLDLGFFTDSQFIVMATKPRVFARDPLGRGSPVQAALFLSLIHI